MTKEESQAVKTLTPIDVVQKNNPLVKGIAETSTKWNKRWPDIERPWPVEGTFNLDVINILRVLITAHKAGEKKGKKGKARVEKRTTELAMLQLFEYEGHRLLTAARAKNKLAKIEVAKNLKKTEELMEKVNSPFSHISAVKSPPPYEKEVEYTPVYPQLPVINHEGKYKIKDDYKQTVEKGKAKTIIHMYPSSKNKTKKTYMDNRTNDSDTDGAIGGYNPTIKRMLTKAEKRGIKASQVKESDQVSSSESTDEDDDDNPDDCSSLVRSQCPPSHFDSSDTGTPEHQQSLDSRMKELQMMETSFVRKGDSLLKSPAYYLRSKASESSDKMLPVLVRGHNLDYKPWQNSDMTDILEKLPTLQDGAHAWISKLEEILVGTQPAMGDMKRLLASLLGIPAMEEILQKAGLQRYIDTAVNDPELFSAHRGRFWTALRETFPTNMHPDNILIEPLGPQENPRAYVTRAHQVWRNVTGSDPDLNQMEQSILRTKIQKGLPASVRSRLAEVVGLGSMTKSVYTDHIAHQVELYRKKEQDQREQDQDTLRKFTQLQLTNRGVK